MGSCMRSMSPSGGPIVVGDTLWWKGQVTSKEIRDGYGVVGNQG